MNIPFIIDNAETESNGIECLRQWTENAEQLDIATGYFEIGALLALDGQWQKLKKIRILMGDETSQRTKHVILDAVKNRAESKLDESMEKVKESNFSLEGVPAIQEAIKKGKIECKIYNKRKFHAKAYILHNQKSTSAPCSRGLVGSSNFTRPGLEQNIELNISISKKEQAKELQEWYQKYWEEAVPVSQDMLKVIQRHTRDFTPFEIYAKALFEFCHGRELSAEEWENSESNIFPKLDQYQKEGYWSLMGIAKKHRGAFLCDSVGLGKTFVGLMLIERFVQREGKNVVLFAPKGAREAVWEPHLDKYLPKLGPSLFSHHLQCFQPYRHTPRRQVS